MKKRIKHTIDYFIIILFIAFTGFNSFFLHTHVPPDGKYKITHSHPFAGDKDKKPVHSHGKSELQLIHLLNNYIAELNNEINITGAIFFFQKESRSGSIFNKPYLTFSDSQFFRGPPTDSNF